MWLFKSHNPQQGSPPLVNNWVIWDTTQSVISGGRKVSELFVSNGHLYTYKAK